MNFKKYHVDALAARMVTHPQTLDVIVASNLFGDILTDLGAAISGSLGLAASGNINPERKYPSMFEPIHGSAPDIKGKGIANPIGAIWAGALMLDHLGEHKAHDMIVDGDHESAVERGYENARYGREGLHQGDGRCNPGRRLRSAVTRGLGSSGLSLGRGLHAILGQSATPATAPPGGADHILPACRLISGTRRVDRRLTALCRIARTAAARR